jgi:hypothetical protein
MWQKKELTNNLSQQKTILIRERNKYYLDEKSVSASIEFALKANHKIDQKAYSKPYSQTLSNGIN